MELPRSSRDRGDLQLQPDDVGGDDGGAEAVLAAAAPAIVLADGAASAAHPLVRPILIAEDLGDPFCRRPKESLLVLLSRRPLSISHVGPSGPRRAQSLF